MLTKSSIRLRAALLADGFMADYLQFILAGADASSEIGSTPFGEGLQSWIKNSPGFNLEKVTAPLLIATQSERKMEGIAMWQPFAGLRYLKKPVELVMLNTEEHVITNPLERMASQGLSVDWFRFWLQAYEDPDTAKAEQYRRWHELNKLHKEAL